MTYKSSYSIGGEFVRQEDDPFQGFISNVHDQIREAYKKGLGDGWFIGYDQGYDDGETEFSYDPRKNPYRSDDDQ